MRLTKHQDSIKTLNPLTYPSAVNVSKWRKSSYSNISEYDINTVLSGVDNSISRIDVINFIKKNPDKLLSGFILSMIWGYGTSGYGPYRVYQMLKRNNDTEAILSDVLFALGNDDIGSAHETFRNMSGIGISFFSKHLYFLGRAISMKKYPLIFDIRVARAIQELATESHSIISTLTVTPGLSSTQYLHYVDSIHEIASNLDVEADQVELFLFMYDMRK